ncbi:NADP-dependent oxidoreductase domain-containing protein, partial [Boletus coccyginus]
MYINLEESLKKLRTSYVDIFYVHWWDWETSIEEVMDGLHTLVQQGKVLYLGVSDTPAWIVSQANQYARDHGKTPFVIYQGLWNVTDRSVELEIVPMCKALGGRLRGDEEKERSGDVGRAFAGRRWRRNKRERSVSAALNKVGTGASAKHITAVTIAYVMQRASYLFPVAGGRKVEQLEAMLKRPRSFSPPSTLSILNAFLPLVAAFRSHSL